MSSSVPEYAWTPERLIHYPLITDGDLSPDGTQVAYTLAEPVLTEEESKIASHLYRVAAEGGEPLRLTYGPASNTSPRWSPDGRIIAFLSDRKGGKGNLHALRADGGEAWPLTDMEKGVSAFAWSPDGQRLAFIAPPADSVERKASRKAKDDPLRVDVDLEWSYLWVVSFAPGGGALPEARPLTGDGYHVTSLDWTADGRSLAFTYQPQAGDDHWPDTRLAVVEVQEGAVAAGEQAGSAIGESRGADIRELGKTASFGACRAHGDWVACPTALDPPSWAFHERVVLYPLTGDGGLSAIPPRPLALTADALPSILGWSADGKHVYVWENKGTSASLCALSIDGSAPLPLLEGPGFFSARANSGGAFAIWAQGLDQPNYLALFRPGDAAWRKVAQPTMPADWPADRVPHSEVVCWPSTDGYEIEGIVTYPLGYQPGRAYPTLVYVHGGPMGVFGQAYAAQPSLYPSASFAERGYVLLRPNPRGSGGRGAAFREANRRDWGGGDYRDIISGVDALIERGIADPQRLGIMGWSYGGYMTSWVITQTGRFRAASVGAGVTNLMSFTGTSDITGFLPDYLQAEYWDDLEVYRQHSAMFNMKGVTTPTLIQHGEDDVRVPLGQGRELYNALKRQGVTVEMVIYPRTGHGLTEPRLLMDVMQRNLDWFDRWLK